MLRVVSQLCAFRCARSLILAAARSEEFLRRLCEDSQNPQGANESYQLLADYRRATEAYSSAIAELSRRIGISLLDDYRRLREAAERACLHSIEACDRLARHSDCGITECTYD
jgi:hypothetical protein